MPISSNKPTVHLFIPYLLRTLIVWQKDFNFQSESPHLSKLLRQYSLSKNHANGLSEALFASIGLADNTEIPMAHYRYQVHTSSISEDPIICADPVHLKVGLNDVTLTEAITDLSRDEAKELIDVLNQHFKEDGLRFILGSNSQWYVALSSQASKTEHDKIKSYPLESVLKKNIAKSLLVSKGRNWQAIQNEMQMLLHATDINQQREMSGLPTVNSLWLWGAGKPIERTVTTQTISAVMGRDENDINAGKSLSKAIACEFKTLSEEVNWKESLTGNTMLVLDHLTDPALNEGPEKFQQTLTTIDKQYIKPLMDLWNKKEIELIIDSCDVFLLHPEKLATWKCLKKPASLLNVAKTVFAQKG